MLDLAEENRELRAKLDALEVRFNPYHDEKGRFTSGGNSSGNSLTSKQGLTGKHKRGKIKTAVKLPPKEYAHVMHEINTYWNEKYKGLKNCKLELSEKTYYFENYGFDNYKIYKIRWRKK